ncbi:MAG TPA: ATP-dependent helicase HrpB [Marinagarivorans sp.]
MQLPIHDCMPELLDALNNHHQCLLQAPPGAGKTTQVPLSLLNESWLRGQKIVVLEPRRVAALNAAARMAKMLDEAVGQTVGYRMRQATKVSAQTRVEVITEGLLTRWLQDDPELKGVGIVIFDEFHERSLNTDVGLALCLQARSLFRDEDNPLKLLVMSATLDSENVAALFESEGDTQTPTRCPIVTSAGRSYPVVIHYQTPSTQQKTNAKQHDFLPSLVTTLYNALEKETGSLLVFLPGVGEIERTQKALTRLPSNVTCRPLHGSLALAQQQAAIEPGQANTRKIVLATDIAETSLTIEGVRVVIDSGLARAPVFDPNTGLTRLHTQNISQASAEQRTGRAGRTEPGVCYRLWPEQQHKQRLKHSQPEIINADLMPLAITLLHWGANHFSELSWLDPPSEANWQQALDALKRINALEDKQLTEIGKRMATFACHPRLAYLLINAERYGNAALGGLIAALLSERSPKNLGSDLYDHINAIERANQGHHKQWQQRVKQLAQQLAKPLRTTHKATIDRDDLTALLIARAFPERIAKRKGEQNAMVVFQLANGRAAQLPVANPLAHQQWLCIADVGGMAGKSHDMIFCAAALNPRYFDDELKDLTETLTLAQWDESKGRFIAQEQRKVGAIVLKQSPLRSLPADVKQQALTALVRDKGLELLAWDKASEQLVARVEFLRQHHGAQWPDMSAQGLLATLEQWLTPHLSEINTLADFKKIALTPLLKACLSWPQPQQLDELAPTTIAIPSGRNAALDYQQSPPVLAVKLQEMFGCTQTPTILNGQQQVMVHLLSPAKQPLQVTQDLAAFWANGYAHVKKEMKGRYPRHPWPDDPLSMTATSKTKRALARQ